MDGAWDVDSGGVGEDGGICFEGGEFFGVVDVFDEVSGVVGALVGVLGCDFVDLAHGDCLVIFLKIEKPIGLRTARWAFRRISGCVKCDSLRRY